MWNHATSSTSCLSSLVEHLPFVVWRCQRSQGGQGPFGICLQCGMEVQGALPSPPSNVKCETQLPPSYALKMQGILAAMRL